MYAEELRKNFNHDITDSAADEIDTLEVELAAANDLLRRCKIVMECNDPTNYKLIFGES